MNFEFLVVVIYVLAFIRVQSFRLDVEKDAAGKLDCAVFLAGVSWFVLGIWYGIGNCPGTDWHWQVRMELGHLDVPNSYVKFLIDSVSGLKVNVRLVDG